MNRKTFLQSSISLAAISTVFPVLSFAGSSADVRKIVKPPYLKDGDTIGITSPASYISLEEIQAAIKAMEGWGFMVKIGETIGKRDFTFGGTDEERTRDFQNMLNDKSVKAIMCARGGYGVVRMIDKINWSPFRIKPKWIIGFSDITAFHSHINRHFGIASIHSKMCNSFPENPEASEPVIKETIESIRFAITGKKINYSIPVNSSNRVGMGSGELVGGNLKMLETLAGTSSDLYTNGNILFLEDTGEQPYSIDRMFWHLKRTGKLSKLKGLVLGGFSYRTEEGREPFGKTVEEIVMEKVKDYNYPVCYGFPVGHQKNNFALKCGIRHLLQVQNEQVSLTEI